MEVEEKQRKRGKRGRRKLQEGKGSLSRESKVCRCAKKIQT